MNRDYDYDGRPRYYDREGKPIPFMGWVARVEDRDDDSRRVAQDTVGDFWISTVWLGLDHAFRFHEDERDAPPLIFETMIHNNASDEWEDYQERYSTEAQALVGHRAAVRYAQGQGAVMTAFGGIIAAAIAEHALRG